MRDFRYALRLIAKSPWLSLIAVVSLALGLGANTTIFSVANGVLLQKPPVANPAELVEVYTHDPAPRAALNGDYPLSYLDYLDYERQNTSLSGLLIYDPLSRPRVITTPGSAPQAWTGQLVSANYFDVLGIHPALGRWFMPSEGAVKGSSAVVVLSWAEWQTQFGGERSILGRTVTLNGAPYVVVGVAPRGFQGLFRGVKCQFWAPVTMAQGLGMPNALDSRGNRSWFAAGRLKPGVTLAAAQVELNALQHTLDQKYLNNGELPTFGAVLAPIGNIPLPFRGFATGGILLLEVVVGLVLLIACANAALVLLAQALGKQREWALRAALGAGRGRLIRQGLVHSVVLAVIAGGLALGIAQLLHPLLLRLAPAGPPIALPAALNGTVIGFTFGLALAIGILFGLAPALQASRVRVLDYIKDGTPGAGAAHSRTRSGFIVAQMALCVVVLVGAGLCLRSLARARTINPGFDVGHLIVADINPQALGHNGAEAQQFMKTLRAAVDAVPGVSAAAYSTQAPLQVGESDTFVMAPGLAPPPHALGFRSEYTFVSPDYFRASGTPLLAGRGFTEADVSSGRQLVVINQTLAKQFYPGGDAVGRTFLFPGRKDQTATVVGVAADGKYNALDESPRPYFYELEPIGDPAAMVIHVAGDPAAFVGPVRTALQKLDPNLMSSDLQTGAEFMQTPLFTAKMTGVLLGGFGLLALLLAVVGLYGVMAAAVARRTREYGIRLALGADTGALLRLVLGQGLRLAAWGIVAGVILAALLTRYMTSLLYGMSAADPVSYIGAAALLVVVTVLACLAPALRATRVDPLRALRQE